MWKNVFLNNPYIGVLKYNSFVCPNKVGKYKNVYIIQGN